MEENKDIETYFLRIDEVVNTMKGLGEKIKDINIVQKVLRSLPVRFNPKLSALEEITNLDTLEMDELHGILTVYEMRNASENPSRKEAAFKAAKRDKKKVETEISNHEDSEEYVEEDDFVKSSKKR